MPLRFSLATGATGATGGCRLREQTARIDVDAAVGAPAVASVGDPLAGERDRTQFCKISFDLGVADYRQQAIIRFVLAISHVVQVVIAPGLGGGDFLFELFCTLLQQLAHGLK